MRKEEEEEDRPRDIPQKLQRSREIAKEKKEESR